MNSKQRLAIHREVERTLGTGIICDRCGARFETYGDKCSAASNDTCPGLQRIKAVIEAVRAPIERAALK